MEITSNAAIIKAFFQLVFKNPNPDHFYCICTKQGENWANKFFSVSGGIGPVVSFIENNADLGDVYFCPNTFKTKSRKKEEVSKYSNVFWADLDSFSPKGLMLDPTLVLETSQGNYQAFWILNDPVETTKTTALSQAIYLKYKGQGVDACWEPAHAMRIPTTYNHKPGKGDQIEIAEKGNRYNYDSIISYFNELDIENINDRIEFDVEKIPTESAQEIIDSTGTHSRQALTELFSITDWERSNGKRSSLLWRLAQTCFEHNLSMYQSFKVCWEAPYNKFIERNKVDLWQLIVKAQHEHFNKFGDEVPLVQISEKPPMDIVKKVDLLTPKQREYISDYTGFVEKYIDWASVATDAPSKYHLGSGLLALSTIMGYSVHIPTTFGDVKANLWLMILGETTRTRKTTSMNLMLKLLDDAGCDDSFAMTEGTVEGIIKHMGENPTIPALFARDEVAGLFKEINNKEYLSGMLQNLTRLYDGSTVKKKLKTESLTIKNPCLVFYGTGIFHNTMEVLTSDTIDSGFIPRFMFINATNAEAHENPLGPPMETAQIARMNLVDHLKKLSRKYKLISQDVMVETDSNKKIQNTYAVSLTENAWKLYNHLSDKLKKFGIDHPRSNYMYPMCDRLTISALKIAALLKGDQLVDHPYGKIMLDERDILKAYSYIEQMAPYSFSIVEYIGDTKMEKHIRTVQELISSNKGTASHESVSRDLKLGAKESMDLLNTMEVRGFGRLVKDGTNRWHITTNKRSENESK